MAVAQLIMNGLLVGSILALGGVGLTLVYGILRLVNFAHGDLLTIGAYAAWIVVAGLFVISGWQLLGALALVVLGILIWDQRHDTVMRRGDRILAAGTLVVLLALAGLHVVRPVTPALALASGLVVSAVSVALLSVFLELGLWRRMRRERANLLTLMIISIGLAFVLRSLVQMTFGADLRVFFRQALAPSSLLDALLARIGLGALRVSLVHSWILATTVVAFAITYLILNHSRTGKAMRALSDDVELAKVAGIDVDRVVLHVWILGGALAGLAGALLAMMTSLHVNLGWFNLLPLFAAVILGGVGSVPGVVIGGLLIGVTQELSVLWIPSGYKLAVGFAILILTLLVRPQGIMGVAR